MNEESFWTLVAQCRQESKNTTELTSRILFRHLRKLNATEVTEFIKLR